ncbi:MAG: T9SS type A sorting domain-containing protein [Bacteroidetes bacterium]|nr:MAG: T9SS type A sorting domain-containing protein [Bacteroidota bacterium]
MKYCLTVLLLFAGLSLATGQTLERHSGELLIRLRPEVSPANVLAQLNRLLPGGAPLAWGDIVAPDWQIYQLNFDESGVDAQALLEAARALPDVQAAQFNHRVYDRDTQPNDPDWFQQDDLTLIGMTTAWDVSTGGVTANGDTIVVAVLEKGALLEHPDLAPNVWYNWAEIPGNGVDDDGNGYTDDYRGWNPRTGDDDPGSVGFHGTAVNGIIGAKGNNGIGVTGISWNVKLMNLANVEYESEILAAYAYVGKMRELYNTTNGAKGAFVVATNASFGIDFERASDHPLWCAAYDALGVLGVLSVGATSNKNVNVDVEGDMPSTCPSEYLITVNNIDKFDNKVANTGYGPISIDLGAPGQGTYTTRSQGDTPQYGTFDGTSAATPHVTGAIGFLYSLQCEDMVRDALSAPSTCAKRMRDIILQNVSPNETLKDITATDGRLDVAAAVRAVQELCGGTGAGQLDILWVRPNPVRDLIQVKYRTPAYTEYSIRVFNMLGQLMIEDAVIPDPFSNNIWEYDVHALPAGVYSVAFGRNEAWRSVKFVKN